MATKANLTTVMSLLRQEILAYAGCPLTESTLKIWSYVVAVVYVKIIATFLGVHYKLQEEPPCEGQTKHTLIVGCMCLLLLRFALRLGRAVLIDDTHCFGSQPLSMKWLHSHYNAFLMVLLYNSCVCVWGGGGGGLGWGGETAPPPPFQRELHYLLPCTIWPLAVSNIGVGTAVGGTGGPIFGVANTCPPMPDLRVFSVAEW